MIAVDTNVLVYAHRAETEHHADALGALTELAEGDEPWGLPVFVIGEFLRVVTHPRVFSPPSSMTAAIGVISALVDSPRCSVLSPRDRHLSLLTAALDEGGATGNLVFDAQIVAVCREHGVSTVLTNDRDFRRFPSVTVQLLDQRDG